MFNKTHITRVTQGPNYPQTIHEHRAPTSDSIELAKGMMEEAKDSILDIIEVDDNNVNGKVIVCRDPYSLGIIASYKFTLNGKPYRFDERTDELPDKRGATKILIDKISKAIAASLFVETAEFQ